MEKKPSDGMNPEIISLLEKLESFSEINNGGNELDLSVAESALLVEKFRELASLGFEILADRGTFRAVGEFRTALLPYKNFVERNKSRNNT